MTDSEEKIRCSSCKKTLSSSHFKKKNGEYKMCCEKCISNITKRGLERRAIQLKAYYEKYQIDIDNLPKNILVVKTSSYPLYKAIFTNAKKQIYKTFPCNPAGLERAKEWLVYMSERVEKKPVKKELGLILTKEKTVKTNLPKMTVRPCNRIEIKDDLGDVSGYEKHLHKLCVDKGVYY